MSQGVYVNQGDSAVPEPEVTVPEGDFNAGKTLFEDLCRSCHKMRVLRWLLRATARESRPLLSAVSSVARQAPLPTTAVKP
jgi:cytochrome c1